MSDEATLRDTFAAAALTGLLASDQYDQLVTPADYSGAAYELADSMLRERAKTIHDAAPAARASGGRDRTDKPAPRPDAGTGDTHARFCSAVMHFISEATSSFATEHPNSRRIMADACAECWDAFDRLAHQTIHQNDGESDRPQPIESTPVSHATPVAGTERRGCTEPAGTRTTHSAPACDGVDVLPDAGSGGPINHSAPACQPPVASRGSEESERRDVARPDTKGKVAGGPAHHTQEPVAWACVGDDEIVCDSHIYCTESVAERWARFDGNRVVPLYRQAPDNAPQAPDFEESLAWAVVLSDGRTYGRYDCRWEADAIAAALPTEEGVVATVAPLYRSPQPTLTDAERAAVERAIATLDGWQARGGYHSALDDDAATLRGLLERLQ